MSKGDAKGGGKGGKGGNQESSKAKSSSGEGVEGAKPSPPVPKISDTSQSSVAASSVATPSPPGQPSSTESPNKLKAMIAEAHQMLQDLKTSSRGSEGSVEIPKMAMVWADLPDIPQLPQLNFEQEKDALLDSGASHALRPPKNTEEAASAELIEVILAGDGRKSLRQNAGGTLLSDAPGAQTILPLGALVRELGCSIKWTRKGLTLRHPTYGVLRTQIRGGCPQLAETEALRLISDLENKRLERFEGQLCELKPRSRRLKRHPGRNQFASISLKGIVKS